MAAQGAPCGGIDVGGTKIEARLFAGADAVPVAARRIATPQDGFPALLAAIEALLDWLGEAAGEATGGTTGGACLPVGLALPGQIDPETGTSFAANLSASGQRLGAALAARTGRVLPVVNDAMAFTLSEARGGAGAGRASVAGLILGTGLGCGWALEGRLPPRRAGLAVEIGHLGLPARVQARHGLPSRRCGCGRRDCLEPHVSGPGLAALAAERLGRPVAPEALAGAEGGEAVLALWADMMGAVLDAVQLMLDPDCIVLGGGLAGLPRVVARLADSQRRHRLGQVALPPIVLARFGPTSGARGAALLARDAAAAPC